MPGRAVARTGLRMMPTFPPLPLKSRTAGFPQYGFKADISGGPSCRPRVLHVAQFASALRASRYLYHRIPRTASRRCGALVHHRASGLLPLYPRGPRSSPGYVVPVHHRLIDPMRPTPWHSATSPSSGLYALPSLCPLGPRRPLSGSELSLTVLYRHVALRDPGESIGCIYPVPSPTTLAFDHLRRSRHFPPSPPSDSRGVNVFGASLRLAFAYDLSICLPSCRSRLGLRLAHEDFYSRAFDGLVTRTVAGYSYWDNWASFPGGSFIRKNGSWLRCNVDGVQYLDGGTLDDLIFQRGNPERPKLARFTHLRDVHPADRLCSVGSPLESKGEILEVRLEGLAVVLPRLSVHARSRVLLNRQERYPQSFDVVNVVEERSEPLFLVPSCCLTYPLKRAGRAFPALSPERVALGRVPLGPSPSLHCLRCRSLGFVRQLRRFYETVRLPASVRHRRASFDFPIRSAVLSSADRRGISRFRLKVLAYMHGVSDRAGSWYTLRWRCTRYSLPTFSRASASRSTCRLRGRACISRLNTRPVRPPVNASTPPSRAAPHDSGPLWFANPSTYETFIHDTLPV